MAQNDIHPTARCDTSRVGSGSRIGSDSIVSRDGEIGSSCILGERVRISGQVTVGNRVHIDDGAHLTGPLVVGDDVRIGAEVSIGTSGAAEARNRFVTEVGAGSIIGKNASIASGVAVALQALVEDGATVSTSVGSYMAFGKDGKHEYRSGFVPVPELVGDAVRASSASGTASKIPGVELIRFHEAVDSRGKLIAMEVDELLPFQAKRLFTVSSVPEGELRGIHAHRECHQFMIPVSGEVDVIVADGVKAERWVLDSPSIGLHIPPLVWGTQLNFSKNATILVLASDSYRPEDYIHHWGDFLRFKGASSRKR